jgi:hypothetical protein
MYRDLLISKDLLNSTIRSSPFRYKVYPIKKRSGSGDRIIAQPAKEVKRLQYWVINNILNKFKVHESATAYVKGKNILNNAKPHCNMPYILKLDFKDFFPSIKGNDFILFYRDNEILEYQDSDIERIIKILFWYPKSSKELQLSIGAPSSPILSNIILFKFDSEIATYCKEKKVNYTRYADDLTFSMIEKSSRNDVKNYVSKIISQLPYPKLTLNNSKTFFGSKAYRRRVTGLIISNDNRVSIGKEKKREIRSKIFHFSKGDLARNERDKLRGILAFVRSVEPDFTKKLEEKFGQNFLAEI